MAKVLFQSTNPRIFRSTLIGYLYEIAQKHQVVLLTEKVDSDTQKILQEKDVFPGLEKIVFFESPFYQSLFLKSYRLHRILKSVMREYRPNVVIAPSDIWPAEMYLMRLAKKAGALTVAMQPGFKIAEGRKQYAWSCIMNAYLNMPRFLPFFVRKFLASTKKYLGHLLYYWILPLAAGEMPFPGKTSFVFWDESSGLRDADYATVFSKRDYDLCAKEGVAREKLFVIGHPLEHKRARMFFEKAYFSRAMERGSQKTLTLMWSEEKIALNAKDYSLIGEQEMQESRVRVALLIAGKLKGWKVFVKPHPAIREVSTIKGLLAQAPENIFVVDPAEPADTYIAISDVIVGTPPPSTTLFTAQKQHPGKIILSLNLKDEFLGDSYKGFEGIEYVDTEEELIRILDAIQEGTFRKKDSFGTDFDFSDAGEMVERLYNKYMRKK